jgi:hypothetical protein
VNIAPIKGVLTRHEDFYSEVPTFIFTTGVHDKDGGFWPFCDYILTYNRFGSFRPDDVLYGANVSVFKGVFYNYDIKTFLVYILLGLCLVFIPMLWTGSQEKSIEQGE